MGSEGCKRREGGCRKEVREDGEVEEREGRGGRGASRQGQGGHHLSIGGTKNFIFLYERLGHYKRK